MCGTSDNQATKTKCMEVIITNQGRKQREKERENTQNLFTQFGPNWPSLWERAAPCFTIMMSNFIKEISMGYKNKSPT